MLHMPGLAHTCIARRVDIYPEGGHIFTKKSRGVTCQTIPNMSRDVFVESIGGQARAS